ncbi:hypothetical protein [Roseibium sp.]|uniref:hypothetical protein n=1 Tax=Roseibium sp. TaxID=1936156 RepID=UPI003D139E81
MSFNLVIRIAPSKRDRTFTCGGLFLCVLHDDHRRAGRRVSGGNWAALRWGVTVVSDAQSAGSGVVVEHQEGGCLVA